MRRRAAFAAAAAALLAACATPPPVPPGALSGRLAVRIEADGERPASGFAAGFELRGGDASGLLRLSTPLGAQIAEARWSPAGASLATADGETAYDDLDALARAALGESLPLRALPDWLRGRPWPGAPAATIDAGFEQLGWRTALGGLAEGRIDAVRETPQPRVTVRARLDPP